MKTISLAELAAFDCSKFKTEKLSKWLIFFWKKKDPNYTSDNQSNWSFMHEKCIPVVRILFKIQNYGVNLEWIFSTILCSGLIL